MRKKKKTRMMSGCTEGGTKGREFKHRDREPVFQTCTFDKAEQAENIVKSLVHCYVHSPCSKQTAKSTSYSIG